MAYSRVKVWIAAEVLTASDLNNEHNGHITNENDLDTRLIAEITSRSALETEHDTFYTACWNAGSSEIAANRVSKISMKDNAIGLNEIEAAATNPAGGVGGLRSFGTTAITACAGNDSRLSDARPPTVDSVGLNNVKPGSIMLPWFEADNATGYTSTSDSWEVVTDNFRVYIPANATMLRLAARVKSTAGAGNIGYSRFTVGALNSNAYACENSATYNWQTNCILDVSGLSGWYNMTLELCKDNYATSYLQGFSFIWE